MFFELYQDRKKQYRWRLKSRNGKIIASGESYKNQKDRDRIVEKMRYLATAPIRYTDK